MKNLYQRMIQHFSGSKKSDHTINAQSSISLSSTSANAEELALMCAQNHCLPRSMADVVSAMMREMNNPLSILRANCSYLKHYFQDNQQIAEVLEENNAQVERLVGLLATFMEMMQRREEDDHPIDIRLNALLSTVELVISPLLKQQSASGGQWVEWINDLPKYGLPKIQVEAQQTKQLLVELIRELLVSFEQITNPYLQLEAMFLPEQSQLQMKIISNGSALSQEIIQKLSLRFQVLLSVDQESDGTFCVVLAFSVNSNDNAHIALIDESCMEGFSRLIGQEFSSLISGLQTDLDYLIHRMMKTVEQKNWHQLITQLHDVKGFSRSICAYRLGSSASELEFLLRQEQVDESLVYKHWGEFIEVVELTFSEFQTYLTTHKEG